MSLKTYKNDPLEGATSTMPTRCRYGNCRPYLQRLSHTRGRAAQRRLIETATRKQIQALSTATRDAIQGRMGLNRGDIRRLYRHREHLRALACPRTGVAAKKRLLADGCQVGGFLPALLGVIAPVVGSLIGKLIGSSSSS